MGAGSPGDQSLGCWVLTPRRVCGVGAMYAVWPPDETVEALIMRTERLHGLFTQLQDMSAQLQARKGATTSTSASGTDVGVAGSAATGSDLLSAHGGAGGDGVEGGLGEVQGQLQDTLDLFYSHSGSGGGGSSK